jgi:hypothetical protein
MSVKQAINWALKPTIEIQINPKWNEVSNIGKDFVTNELRKLLFQLGGASEVTTQVLALNAAIEELESK